MAWLPNLAARPLAGTSLAVSPVGFALDPEPMATPGTDRQLVESLRRARDQGVNLFDVAGARFPVRARALLRSAFPAPDPGIVILFRAPMPANEEREPEHSGTSPSFVPGASEIPEVPWSPRDRDAFSTVAEGLRAARDRGALSAWSVRLDRASMLGGSVALPGKLPELESCELSILDAPALASAPPPGAGPARSLIARDPFAGGLLDGSRFGAGLIQRRPGQAPRDVRELREEFGPVLRLGFLTAHRKRTLAQVAIQFLLQRPGTLAVLVPPPPPERWDEILRAPDAPPLSGEELERLEGPGPVGERAVDGRSARK